MSKKKLPWRCKDEKQAKDKNRIYASKRWQELRVLKLQSTNGLCEVCIAEGKAAGIPDGILTPTNIVHHKHPIEDSHSFQEMEHWAYLWENLLTVCQRHHAEAHRRIGSQTKEVVKQRAKQRQDRWVEQMKNKFIKDNQGTMQENKRLGIFGTLNYDKLKDMTMDERKLAVTNHAKDILTRKTKDGKGPQIPDDDRNLYDITAKYTIMDCHYNKQGNILATFKAQRTDEGLTIELTSFETATT